VLLRLSKSPVVVEEGVVVSVGGFSPDEDDMHRNNHAATQHGSESPLRTVNRMLAFLVPKNKTRQEILQRELEGGQDKRDQRSRNQVAKITI